MTKKQFLTLAGIFIFGCMIMIFASVAKKYHTKIEWNGTTYNIENVNAVDAKFAQPYKESLDEIGDIFVGIMGLIGLSLIVVSFIASKDKKKSFLIACYDLYTYMVCSFYANGFYRILKTVAGRIRPYMYFANPSEEGIAKGDFFRSWPSGHSANVFLALGFIFAWYKFRQSDSKLKKPILIISLLLCITTMILRMLSGNHFLTDVLSGAAIGFTISYSMAVLCNRIYKIEK